MIRLSLVFLLLGSQFAAKATFGPEYSIDGLVRTYAVESSDGNFQAEQKARVQVDASKTISEIDLVIDGQIIQTSTYEIESDRIFYRGFTISADGETLRVFPESGRVERFNCQILPGQTIESSGNLINEVANEQTLTGPFSDTATFGTEFESVTVPAGTFQTVRVEQVARQTTSFGVGFTSETTTTSTIWIANHIGVVKSTSNSVAITQVAGMTVSTTEDFENQSLLSYRNPVSEYQALDSFPSPIVLCQPSGPPLPSLPDQALQIGETANGLTIQFGGEWALAFTRVRLESGSDLVSWSTVQEYSGQEVREGIAYLPQIEDKPTFFRLVATP